MTLKVITGEETGRGCEPQGEGVGLDRFLRSITGDGVMKGLLVKEHLNPRKRKE